MKRINIIIISILLCLFFVHTVTADPIDNIHKLNTTDFKELSIMKSHVLELHNASAYTSDYIYFLNYTEAVWNFMNDSNNLFKLLNNPNTSLSHTLPRNYSRFINNSELLKNNNNIKSNPELKEILNKINIIEQDSINIINALIIMIDNKTSTLRLQLDNLNATKIEVETEYNTVKGKFQKSILIPIIIFILIGLMSGFYICYRWNKMENYLSTFTSAHKTTHPYKYAIIITIVLLIIIFAYAIITSNLGIFKYII
ncbi:MAG: hypothetical protein ACE5KE_14080 [Methanosarcinales archaeon]